MDSFSGKQPIRYQLGRHLAETPYTSQAYGADSPGMQRNVKSEPVDHDSRRYHNMASAGSDSGSKKSSREPLNAPGGSSGPRFTDAPTVIDGDGIFNPVESGLSDEGEGFSSESTKAPSKINKRVLTQRYQLDQMRTIRKKISVEDWICEQLDRLRPYSSDSNIELSASNQAEVPLEEVNIDLEELLSSGGDSERRAFLELKLRNCKVPQSEVESFISECIEKIRPL